MTSITARADASGLIVVHSCPGDLVPHVEWAIAGELSRVVKLRWLPQPIITDTFCAELSWEGATGTAAAITSSLFGLRELRFEVTEDHVEGEGAGRWMYTPSLGVRHVSTDSAGNALLGEDLIRAAIDACYGNATELSASLMRALGDPWDQELEPFRSLAIERREETIFALPRVG